MSLEMKLLKARMVKEGNKSLSNKEFEKKIRDSGLKKQTGKKT